MKTLHYFLLVIFLPLATSCVQEAKENELPVLTEEEMASNKLLFVDNPILFGKVTVNDFGVWKNGWVLDKDGQVSAIEFSELTSPFGGAQFLPEQLEDIQSESDKIFQLDRKLDLANHYFDLEDIPQTMEIEKMAGDSYFAVIEHRFTTPEDVPVGCSSGDAIPFVLYRTKILANPNEILDHKEAIEAVAWLNNLNNELN